MKNKFTLTAVLLAVALLYVGAVTVTGQTQSYPPSLFPGPLTISGLSNNGIAMSGTNPSITSNDNLIESAASSLYLRATTGAVIVDQPGGLQATLAILTSTAFASLGTPTNGTLIFCNNCTVANPCASGGTGALAKRLNGAWVCN